MLHNTTLKPTTVEAEKERIQQFIKRNEILFQNRHSNNGENSDVQGSLFIKQHKDSMITIDNNTEIVENFRGSYLYMKNKELYDAFNIKPLRNEVRREPAQLIHFIDDEPPRNKCVIN